MPAQLNESERDFLASRLLVTLAQLEPRRNLLSDALAVTQLLELIERPVDYETFRPHVHEWLSAFQRNQNQLGLRVGGFANSSKLEFSDPTATADAVELMEYFGVPESVDITSLRSYLRPERTDHWLIRQSAIRVSTRHRLDRLPDVQAVSWWDYLRYERSLWMTILFVMLCIYVVMISHEDEISLKPEVFTSQDEGNG